MRLYTRVPVIIAANPISFTKLTETSKTIFYTDCPIPHSGKQSAQSARSTRSCTHSAAIAWDCPYLWWWSPRNSYRTHCIAYPPRPTPAAGAMRILQAGTEMVVKYAHCCWMMNTHIWLQSTSKAWMLRLWLRSEKVWCRRYPPIHHFQWLHFILDQQFLFISIQESIEYQRYHHEDVTNCGAFTLHKIRANYTSVGMRWSASPI